MTTNNHQNQRLIGWDGITVWVPEDWTLSAVSADEKEGYLRADGPEMPRLEIKWSNTPGFVDLDETVDKYLRSIEKSTKRDQQDLTVDRNARIVSKRKMGKDSLKTFAWATDAQAYGAVWVCNECDRTVMAQVMGRPDDDDLLATAEQVLSSINEHPSEGWTTWAAYGFVCQIPEDFTLSSQKMFAALMQLSFTRDTEKITVGRWGMAETLLADRTLDDWLQEELGKELSRYAPSSEEQEFRGHKAISFRGDRMLPLHNIKSFMRHIIGKQCADRLLGYAWHCQLENKIFVVYGLLDRTNYTLIDELRDRIECL